MPTTQVYQSQTMIRLLEVVKRYDGTAALDRLSLRVPTSAGKDGGVVFGLLGPNGAGKTTILRLIMGFIFPDAGKVDLGGLEASQIGYVPERAFYPPRFAIRDYLLTSGRLAGMRPDAVDAAADNLLDQFGLGGVAHRRLGACSRGMLQRVGLAQALISDPPLLLLDEPASGLDPAGQKFMREQILALRERGKTVLLSSHHLDEVARICSHIAVISRGRLVRSGPLTALLTPRTEVTLRTAPLPHDVPAMLAALAPRIAIKGNAITLAGPHAAHKAAVLRLLLDHEVEIFHLSEHRATLEEAYLEATGE
jgi:ABC-2 type transport system ATP-binding protein